MNFISWNQINLAALTLWIDDEIQAQFFYINFTSIDGVILIISELKEP